MAAAVVLRIFVNGFTDTYLSVVDKSASPSVELENLVSIIHFQIYIIYLIFQTLFFYFEMY